MTPLNDQQIPTQDATAIANFKAVVRATWAAGDFPAVAERNIWNVGERIVRHVGVNRGNAVLDVACGSGNAAIRAAQSGGNVIGVDLTPELFERGRQLAEEAGVQVEWIECDAEALPFEDESFDVVFSTFGCMFAPRHRVAALELARVLRAGGRIGLTTWTPDGPIGEFFKTISEFMPAPPEFASSPVLWGLEAHVNEIFDGTAIEFSFKRETVESPEFESSEDALEYWTTKFGPLVMAKRLTESDGRWPELREKLMEYYDRDAPPEYLVILGQKT
ncbi:MAG: class I SAM-dependent methyltransferase [Phycisphaerales bacterium]|nr:class I SAM-dependent methyltransferase [Phycisphaerales bacterium]